jgi:hypothetical protein
MIKAAFMWLVLLMIPSVGSASLTDLGDYILSTGDQNIVPTIAYHSRNETTGDYGAIVMFGKGKQESMIQLAESNNSTDWNKDKLADVGFKPVKRPYPGFLKINSTDDSVSYIGFVTKNLTLIAAFSSYQEAIDLLNKIQVISRKDYQEAKSDELTRSLTG